MMYVLARKSKAVDLETGDGISYSNFGKNNEIEYDHIFPKSKLESFYQDVLDKPDRTRLINDLCNFAFMTKRGNIIKTNDDPEKYFPKVKKKHEGTSPFEAQSIPFDDKYISYDNYEKFLNKRAKTLAEETNKFLNALR